MLLVYVVLIIVFMSVIGKGDVNPRLGLLSIETTLAPLFSKG